jgi:hypothetical protein
MIKQEEKENIKRKELEEKDRQISQLSHKLENLELSINLIKSDFTKSEQSRQQLFSLI